MKRKNQAKGINLPPAVESPITRRELQVDDVVQCNVSVPGFGRQTGVVVKVYRKGFRNDGDLWVRVKYYVHSVVSFASAPACNYSLVTPASPTAIGAKRLAALTTEESYSYGHNFAEIVETIQAIDPTIKTFVEGGGAAVLYISIYTSNRTYCFSHGNAEGDYWYGSILDENGNPMLVGEFDGFDLKDLKAFEPDVKVIAKALIKYL